MVMSIEGRLQLTIAEEGIDVPTLDGPTHNLLVACEKHFGLDVGADTDDVYDRLAAIDQARAQAAEAPTAAPVSPSPAPRSEPWVAEAVPPDMSWTREQLVTAAHDAGIDDLPDRATKQQILDALKKQKKSS